jgi:hypothetical protein
VSASSLAVLVSFPAHKPIRSSDGTTTTSRLATQWTVLATAWSTYMKNSSLTQILTSGRAARPPHTLPAVVAPWVPTHLLIPMLKASGTATQSDPIPNSDDHHLYSSLTYLISKLASSPTPFAVTALTTSCIPWSFLFSQHFSEPIVWIHTA